MRALSQPPDSEAALGAAGRCVGRFKELLAVAQARDFVSVVIAFSGKHFWERACDILLEMHASTLDWHDRLG